MDKVSLETKFKIDFFIDRIAKRLYPPVFVVDEYTDASRFVYDMEHLPYSVQIEMAREAGIPVLDGLAVVENLRGEMDPSSEWVLREEVRWISSAKQGMVIVDDEDPERLKEVAGRTGEAPFTAKTVPVDELLQKDVDQTLWFFGMLEAFTFDLTVAFTIPLTDRVNSFLEEQVTQ